MNKLYVVIMRAQQFHIGHEHILSVTLEEAAKEPTNQVMVLLGSANKTRSMENPFTFNERAQMIRGVFPRSKLIIKPLPDFDYDDRAWEDYLHETIGETAKTFWGHNYFAPVFVSGAKDSDDHLRKLWARGADVVAVDPITSLHVPISATAIRKALADGRVLGDFFPKYDINIIQDGMDFLEMEKIKVDKYKEMWKFAPYPVQFSATDALIRDASGKYLLIERGGEFGEGCLALVGGFLEENFTYEDNMKKEVQEETGICLDDTLHTIVTSWVCDNPKRDSRGRMTTMAFLVQLHVNFENIESLRAGDDAADVHFYEEDNLFSLLMWADHYGIARKLLTLEQQGVRYIKNN